MDPRTLGPGFGMRGGRFESPPRGLVRARDQQPESYVNVADDIFDFAEKALLFSSSSPYPSDCVIVLKDDKEVYVQKSLLAFQSEYFKVHFAKDNSDRIALGSIDHDEFVELLCVIYPSGHPITARNVEALSKLAHQFKMSDLLKRCNMFLLTNNTKLSKSKLLLLAQDYDMKRLQEHYVKGYKRVEDVKAIQHEPEYASLNYQTRRMLLDSIIEFSLTYMSMGPSNAHYYRYGPYYGDYENNQFHSDLEAEQPDAKQRKPNNNDDDVLKELSSSTFCAPDIILVVEDIEIQAHKQYLSVHSQYFNGMFKDEFKEGHENVVVIQGIGYLEMLELLSVVYPTEYPITGMNIRTILKLADRFIMPAVMARCKKALKYKIKGALKLWSAQQYNFSDLQEEFARQYKTMADVLKAKAEPEFEEFNDKTRALILDSITLQNRGGRSRFDGMSHENDFEACW